MKLTDLFKRRIAQKEDTQTPVYVSDCSLTPASDDLVELAEKALYAAHEKQDHHAYHEVKGQILHKMLFDKEQLDKLTTVIRILDTEQRRINSRVLFTQVICGTYDPKESQAKESNQALESKLQNMWANRMVMK